MLLGIFLLEYYFRQLWILLLDIDFVSVDMSFEYYVPYCGCYCEVLLSIHWILLPNTIFVTVDIFCQILFSLNLFFNFQNIVIGVF